MASPPRSGRGSGACIARCIDRWFRGRAYHREGRIREIADYCETDVVNTYRVWLRYELFRGKLIETELEASEENLRDYIKTHSNTKPHLTEHLRLSRLGDLKMYRVRK
jgi:hypothetical protein